MLTVAFFHSAYSYAWRGSGFIAGLSMVSKRLRRQPSIFLNLRLLNSISFSAMALLSSAKLKKVWFLRAANIHISAIFTAVSTLALSFGLATRVGIITVL